MTACIISNKKTAPGKLLPTRPQTDPHRAAVHLPRPAGGCRIVWRPVTHSPGRIIASWARTYRLDSIKHSVPELASAVLGLHQGKGGLAHALAHLPLGLHDLLQDLAEPARHSCSELPCNPEVQLAPHQPHAVSREKDAAAVFGPFCAACERSALGNGVAVHLRTACKASAAHTYPGRPCKAAPQGCTASGQDPQSSACKAASSSFSRPNVC